MGEPCTTRLWSVDLSALVQRPCGAKLALSSEGRLKILRAQAVEMKLARHVCFILFPPVGGNMRRKTGCGALQLRTLWFVDISALVQRPCGIKLALSSEGRLEISVAQAVAMKLARHMCSSHFPPVGGTMRRGTGGGALQLRTLWIAVEMQIARHMCSTLFPPVRGQMRRETGCGALQLRTLWLVDLSALVQRPCGIKPALRSEGRLEFSMAQAVEMRLARHMCSSHFPPVGGTMRRGKGCGGLQLRKLWFADLSAFVQRPCGIKPALGSEGWLEISMAQAVEMKLARHMCSFLFPPVGGKMRRKIGCGALQLRTLWLVDLSALAQRPCGIKFALSSEGRLEVSTTQAVEMKLARHVCYIHFPPVGGKMRRGTDCGTLQLRALWIAVEVKLAQHVCFTLFPPVGGNMRRGTGFGALQLRTDVLVASMSSNRGVVAVLRNIFPPVGGLL